MLPIPTDVSTQSHNVGCQLPTQRRNPFMVTPYFDISKDVLST